MAAQTAAHSATELAAFVDCHFAGRGLVPEPVIAGKPAPTGIATGSEVLGNKAALAG